LNVARHLAAGLASLPLVSWQTAPPSLLLLPLYYAFLAALLLGRHRPRLRLTALPMLLSIIVLALWHPSPAKLDGLTRATFLDVGQGAATLLELADSRTILIDGGSTSGAKDFDPGEQIIAPFLRSRGLGRLDAIVISHDHADHYNGLPYIIKNFRPQTLWVNATTGISSPLKEILALAEAAGSQIKVPDQGTNLITTPKARLACLSQFHQAGDRSASENSRSLVLELVSDGHRIILPGYIMAEDAEVLRRSGMAPKCSVLLAPHHGSDNSASLTLTRDSRPAWVVVSAGAGSKNNFPGPDLLSWCSANHTRVYRTGDEGAISFSLGPEGITWRKLSAKAGSGAQAGIL
jgi:competence protein ComEC